MTSSSITKVPALGQASSGDWQARIFERLRVRGLESVTALSERYPTASTIEMADELSSDHEAAIDHADVPGERRLPRSICLAPLATASEASGHRSRPRGEFSAQRTGDIAYATPPSTVITDPTT